MPANTSTDRLRAGKVANQQNDRARPDPAEIASLLAELTALRADLVADDRSTDDAADDTHPNYRASARNLRHYLRLRRHDLRTLQHRLTALGLSSLGRAESHVLATLDAVLDILQQLHAHCTGATPLQREIDRVNPPIDFDAGDRVLEEHTNSLLGAPTEGRRVRIMVTMPSEAATDYTVVRDLLKQGMDCMRINCAHDDTDAWQRMIDNLRRAESALGLQCKVVMDLGGPKLRTGPVEPGPAVLHLRPTRDEFGRVTAPARIWLTSETLPQRPPSDADASIPVAPGWLAALRIGDRVRFTDTRGSKRMMRVVDPSEGGAWAQMSQSAYIAPGTRLRAEPREEKNGIARSTVIGAFAEREGSLRVHIGDALLLTSGSDPGRPATVDESGKVLTPVTIGCSIPEVLGELRNGDSIWFDDGKIGGVIETAAADHALVRITHAREKGAKLSADKGINLPDSSLTLSALTAQDMRDLEFAGARADVIELSFANSAADVELLQEKLRAFAPREPGIVLKIETRRGFERLPEMLATVMRWPSAGVMIARGDLAIECGFERLAEVQEEILWFCEAAHVPVIWATQVLETLAKEGMPSRAEVTDAAMGNRAECVMLNKGPHVVGAVRVLDDILRRMAAHQTKKSSMLRELSVAHDLVRAT